MQQILENSDEDLDLNGSALMEDTLDHDDDDEGDSTSSDTEQQRPSNKSGSTKKSERACGHKQIASTRTQQHLSLCCTMWTTERLPLHKNCTEYLNREVNGRDLLGKHWQDKTVLDRCKRRLLQSIGHQFPCAKILRLWGLRESDECRLCKRLHPEVTPWLESLGHIQARCPALRKPRIVVHHGIWRELLTAISRNSVETHDVGERKWYFPSAVSEATQDELTVRQIFAHLDLFSRIRNLIDDVVTFHARQNIVLTSHEITSFYSRRPDGVAFDAKNKHCVFLEFTRPMDSVTSSEEGDWAELKELEKNERYGMHIYFISYLSVPHGRRWNYTQVKFTVAGSTQLPQEDPIPRQTLPSWSNKLQSQRQNPSAHSFKNTGLVGHHPLAFPRLHLA